MIMLQCKRALELELAYGTHGIVQYHVCTTSKNQAASDSKSLGRQHDHIRQKEEDPSRKSRKRMLGNGELNPVSAVTERDTNHYTITD